MKHLSLLLALFVLIGCQPDNKNRDKRLKDKDVPVDFDLGEAKNGTYKNKFFGFSFVYNEDWSLQSYDDMERIMQMGSDAFSENEKKEQLLDAAKVRTANLFGVFKHDIGSIESNPNMLMIAENIKQFPSVKYGDEYLELIRELWGQQTQLKISQVGTIQPVKVGGKEFYKMQAELTIPYSGKAYQDYYCIVDKGFALVFALSYTESEELNELEEIVKSMKFKKS
ncbi:hypothetical protein OAK35_01820 [Crocinitomicaceae bacterium]|nr:hypothetical protein [Crocinitomicaceae bacterium]